MSVSRIDFKKNYYAILGVHSNNTNQDIKAAFYKKAKTCHPDLVKGKQEQFKKINQAYEVLSDEKLRKQYDMGRYEQTNSFNAPSYNSKQFNSGYKNKQNVSHQRHNSYYHYSNKTPYQQKFQQTLKQQIEKAFNSMNSRMSQKQYQRRQQKAQKQQTDIQGMFKKLYEQKIKQQQQRIKQYQEWKEFRRKQYKINEQNEMRKRGQQAQKMMKAMNSMSGVANTMVSGAKKIAEGAKEGMNVIYNMFKK